MKKRQRVLTAIVMQGGGARGAYECGVLKKLYEDRPGWKPDVVTGISVGAVNAAVLVGNGIEALETLWRERLAVPAIDPLMPFKLPEYRRYLPEFVQHNLALMDESISLWQNLYNPGMYAMRPEYWATGPFGFFFTSSFCDTAPLQRTLQEFVDFDVLNTSDTRVILTAVNIATGDPVTFGNRASFADYKARNKPAPFANKKRLTVDHILAAGGYTPGFPAHQVDGIYGIDGGFAHSTPLREAITALENYVEAPDEEIIGREVIVVELLPRAGAVPTNAWEAYERSFHILLADKLELDQKLFDRKNSYLDLATDIQSLGTLIEQLGPQIDQLTKNGDGSAEPVAQLVKELTKRMKHIQDEDPAYKELTTEHAMITHFARIPFIVPPQFTSGRDFSVTAIAGRIEAGYKAAEYEELGALESHPVTHKFMTPVVADTLSGEGEPMATGPSKGAPAAPTLVGAGSSSRSNGR